MKHGPELSAFARAALGEDAENLNRARRALRTRVGEAGVVDAAAVIANFSMLDRVADAVGIPLDLELDVTSVALRCDMGIDRLAAAANTPNSLMRRVLRTLLRPLGGFLRWVFKRLGPLLAKE